MKVIFVHICRWEEDLDSQADMHNKYKKFFSGRQVRPDWLEFWTVGPYSDLFRQYNQPCPYITSLQTIMSPYGRKLNLLETLAVVIDNMAQSPAMDLVNTDMGKVNLKNFVHLVHDLRKELRFYDADEERVEKAIISELVPICNPKKDDPAVIPFKVPNQSRFTLVTERAKSTVLKKFAVKINTKLERSLDEGDE